MARTALVSGASIAGLAAAFWLGRTGWEVRVIERAPAFRDGGQNVDVRGVAREVLERMQLTSAVREHTTTEEGTRLVTDDGSTLAEFPQRGEDGPTAELEILRGDLAALLRDALPTGIPIEFGTEIDGVTEGETGAEVTIDGVASHWDLVVVAEGVRSRTRDLVFGDEVRRQALGLAMVYGTISRTQGDDHWWNWYTATGGRQVTLRPDPVGSIRATLAYLSPDDELTSADRETQIARLRDVFSDAGWQAGRVLDGFAASDDVYVDYLTQVMAARWSRRSVVLLGDAAWCVTPLGGGGCSLAVTGAYVLAAMLSQHPGDPSQGLAEYESWMRPLVDSAQKLPPGTPRLFYPRSAIGVGVQRTMARVAGSPPLRDLVAKKMGEVVEDDRDLPELAAV